MRKSAYELMSPRIEKYLSEKDRPQTMKEIAEGLGVASSSIHNVVQLMEVFKVVQKVRMAGRYRYFLTGAYDDEQLSAMFPPKKIKPKRNPRIRNPRRSHLSSSESFLVNHLVDMRRRAIGVEGPSALAMIGLNQIDVVEHDTVPRTVMALRHLDVDVEVEKRRFELHKNIQVSGTVESLPRTVRLLNMRQTKQLKEQLKGLDGYYRIDDLEAAFTEFLDLKNGSYGNVFYFAYSTNTWEQIYKVTVDDPLPLKIEAPKKRLRRKGRSIYDPIIDQFIACGKDLVEIVVEERNASYVRSQLLRRIEERELEIDASSSSGFVYLERMKSERAIA